MKRRVLCLLLAAALAASLGIGAFAEEGQPVPSPEAAEQSAEPEATAEPEVTEEPETTDEPEAEAGPEATVEPDVTAEPEITTEPEATEGPETSVAPEATTEPEATDEPEATEEPEDTEEPGVMTIAAGNILTVEDEYNAIISIVDKSGKSVKSGQSIPADGLTVTVKKGYYLYGFGNNYNAASCINKTENIYSVSGDAGDVTITVMLGTVVQFTGATEGIDTSGTHIVNGETLPVDGTDGDTYGKETQYIVLLKPGYALSQSGYVENGRIDGWFYIVNENGKLQREYVIIPSNHGTLTLTIVTDSSVPEVIPIRVEDPDDVISPVYSEGGYGPDDAAYTYKGAWVQISCIPGYRPVVSGATLDGAYDWGYVYRVNDDATELYVTAKKLGTGTLHVTGEKDAVTSGQRVGYFEEYYLTDGSTIDSEGVLCLKEGYRLEKTGRFDHYTIVEGEYVYSDGNRPDWLPEGLYREYYIATDSDVTVKVVKDDWRLARIKIEGDTDGEMTDYLDGALGGDQISLGYNDDGIREYVVPAGGTYCIGINKGYNMQIVKGGKIVNSSYYGGYYLQFWKYEIKVDDDATELVINITEGILGDVTDSGAVNGDDSLALFRYVLGKNTAPVSLAAGDVTHDGRINGDDSLVLYRYVLGYGSLA